MRQTTKIRQEATEAADKIEVYFIFSFFPSAMPYFLGLVLSLNLTSTTTDPTVCLVENNV